MLTNFRDIGGVTGKYGQLKKAFFYRSGQLTDLDAADKRLIKDSLGIKKIYDFRGASEIEQEPDDVLSNIAYENLDILSSSLSKTSASIQDMLKHSDNITQAMLDTYEQLVVSESARHNYHYFILDIIKNKQPILFHCFAGKDRTGFGAVLLLKMAGIADSLIMRDYLLTNELRQAANKMLLDSLSKEYTAKEIASLKIALKVDRTYLLHAYKVIEQNYGTFDNYLYRGLFLSQGDINEFRKLYVI